MYGKSSRTKQTPISKLSGVTLLPTHYIDVPATFTPRTLMGLGLPCSITLGARIFGVKWVFRIEDSDATRVV